MTSIKPSAGPSSQGSERAPDGPPSRPLHPTSERRNIIDTSGRTTLVASGVFIDYVGDVQVTYLDGRLTEASFDLYLRALMLGPRSQRLGILYLCPEPSTLDGRRRKALGDILAASKEETARNVAAYVMVTPSALVRSFLKAIFWLAPPPYPNYVTSTTLEGCAYLARHMPSVRPRELNEACAQLLRDHEPRLGVRKAG